MRFTKIHGLGNDYIYVDATKYKIDDPRKLSILLSDRHIGIGSDGLILLLNSDVADYKMRIFNADGSEAEMCGNGIRGLGKYIYEKKFCNKDTLTIETKAGIKELKLDIKKNEVVNVTVDMGEITLNPSLIPVKSKKEILNKKIVIDNHEYFINCISVGNPHCVIFEENIKKLNLKEIGPKLESYSLFPQRTNVEFIEMIDENNIMMRVWERGSGETLACGTGACASAVISYLSNKTNNKCTVHLEKGTLNIYFDALTKHVFLTGPTTKVFDGNINIKKLKK